MGFFLILRNWEDYVAFDERYLRPAEVDLLIGDPTKAKTKLNWEPSVTFPELVALMVQADLDAIGVDNGQSATDKAYIRQNVVNKLASF